MHFVAFYSIQKLLKYRWVWGVNWPHAIVDIPCPQFSDQNRLDIGREGIKSLQSELLATDFDQIGIFWGYKISKI